MKIFNHIMPRLLLASTLLCALARPSQALIPVFDKGTMIQCLVNNVVLIVESKFVVNGMNTEGNMNTMMGTSKANFFNFLKSGSHAADGNALPGEYDQDYDHLPDNKVPDAEDAKMKLIEDLGASLFVRDQKLQLASAEIKGSISLSGGFSVASAIATEEKYSGKYSAEDEELGKTDRFVFPDALANYCEINVEDIDNIDKKVKMIECLKKRFRFQISPIQADQKEARDVYYRSIMEEAYANVAEALIARNFAVYYEKEILKPLLKKAIKAKNERDDYAVTMVMNKEIARVLGKLHNVYSMQTSYNMFADYGNFEPYQDELEDKPEDPNPKGTIDKVIVLPKTLAEYCGLDAKEAGEMENKEKVVGCLKSLIAMRESPTQATKREARDIFSKALMQQNYAFFSEALLERLHALDHYAKVMKPIENQGVASVTVSVDYDAIIKSNKEVAEVLSRIMNTYTMKVANDSFQNYGEYEIIREKLLDIE